MNIPQHRLTLRHEEIDKYKPAGTSEFFLKNERLFATLNIGMTVEGTLVVSKEESWIESLSMVVQEPSGGEVVSFLVFYDDSLRVNPEAEFNIYSVTNFVSQDSIVKNGTHSMIGDWSYYGGIRPQLTHHDTSVFWFQDNSRIQFWTRSNVGGNTWIQVLARPLGGLNYPITGWYNPGVNADTWYLVDLAIPVSLRNIPFYGFEITGPGIQHIRYFDDIRVTNVRIHAGPGVPPVAAMDKIAADQIGYASDWKKQFSSAVNFTTFTIKRVSDNVTVYTGDSLRAVSSTLIGNPSSSVYIGDFSALTIPGRYKIIAGGKESYPFYISDNVYDGVTRAVQRMLYYQRAFTAIEQPYAEGPWVHPTDVDKAPSGVVKGWHDAGDLSVYMPTMTQTIYWLLETWTDFHPTADNLNIPESGNGVPDLLDETRWGLEWILSMQNDNAGHTGGFWGTACLNNHLYPGYGRTTPNNVPQYTKDGLPTVQNTAKAVAVLAYASVAFQTYDLTFAARCLTAAQNGWTWMQAHPNETNDGGDCTAYAQGSNPELLKTNRSWAHASLFYATGEQIYNDAFLRDYLPTDWISSYSKSEAFANRTYLRAAGGDNTLKHQIRERIFGAADAVRADADNHPYQCATFYYWGSNSNGLHRTGQFSWQAYLLDKNRVGDRDAGLDNIHYIFGRNYLNICYISGAYRWGATRYRKEGFHHWMKTLNNPDSLFHFPGVLAGGPNESPDFNDRSYPMNSPYPTWGYSGDLRGATASRLNNIRDGSTPIEGRFTDNDSWCTNEIVISWNAVFVYNLYAARAASAR